MTGGICENKPFDEYGIGFCGIEGKEGTWKDAEDGILSKNPIEHGVVDSVISWSKNIPANSSVTLYYWIAVGETYREVCELLQYIFEKTPEHLIESTKDFWQAWINQVEISFPGLSEKAKNLFYDSLLVMRAHTDDRGGFWRRLILAMFNMVAIPTATSGPEMPASRPGVLTWLDFMMSPKDFIILLMKF